jgi:predicted PurR-regulated permease PerM
MPRESLPGEVARTLGGYLKSQLQVAGVLTVIYWAGFALSDVPAWPLIGLLAGVLQLVPFVGGVAGLGIAELANLFGDRTMTSYLGALATFVVAQTLEGFYLTPKFVGRGTGLRPLVVFFAVLIGGFAFGPIGVLFAVPILAVLAVLWRRSRRGRT